jgi:hypothetical protein
MRLPYKAGKTGTYWPGASPRARKQRLTKEWARILRHLRKAIGGIELPLPSHPETRSFGYLKRFEDAIDALVCAWTAVQFLRGAAEPLGDDTAAIWVPALSMRYAKVPYGA